MSAKPVTEYVVIARGKEKVVTTDPQRARRALLARQRLGMTDAALITRSRSNTSSK